MFPQAELENYKLQVELLQEKLQSSEHNRQQLEHKLDKVLQKRNELEKSARHKNRQKYQEFLDEQCKRNERNKKLVQMLERIDEQTAAMSQRSERLKMMKLQYQMYFAKLVQQQTLRCIQQTTAPAGSYPVLLQPQAATAMPAAAAAAAATTTTTTPMHPLMTAATPQQWAYATPTPTGMFLTPQFTPQPVYMPLPELYGGAGAAPLGTSNLFDLRATLRALDNENADLPERMSHFDTSAAAQFTKANMDRAATPTLATLASTHFEPEQRSAQELSSTSSTLATSSLTFDKLPKAATLTELPTSAVAAAAAAGGVVAAGRPQTATRRGSQPAQESDVWASARTEHEKSASVAESEQQQQPQQQQQQLNFDSYFGELKIDEPWQPTTTTLGSFTDKTGADKVEHYALPGEQQTAAGLGVMPGISSELLDEVKASRAALQKAAAAVDEQLARGGNSLSPTATLEPLSKPRVSLENIENAIYGERLTATTAAAAAAAAAAPAIRAAAATTAAATAAAAAAPVHELFENLISKQPTELQKAAEFSAVEAEILPEPSTNPLDYAQYEGSNYGEAGEPSYASIDAGQQQQLLAQGSEPIYSEIGNPTEYQAYAADGHAAGEVETEAAAAQQEYSNMDYSNYDAGQYATGYDPNAYPGYIYDETTGQYIADPNATQYAPDGSYAGQEYDASATNYDYYAEQQPEQQQQEQQQQQQQQQQQEQQEASYPTTDDNNVTAEPLLPQEVVQSPPVEVDPAAIKPVKPASILATADKQAAPNDANQQQQQQQQQKKKKRVNFVDSSETDDSSSVKPAQDISSPPTVPPAATVAPGTAGPQTATGSESDFDFSSNSEAKN